MTIRELAEWAKENDALDKEMIIKVFYDTGESESLCLDNPFLDKDSEVRLSY